MTPEQSDDLDFILDRFELRVRRRNYKHECRIQHARRARLMKTDGPLRGEQFDPSMTTGLKWGLDHYDGHIETHGQD